MAKNQAVGPWEDFPLDLPEEVLVAEEVVEEELGVVAVRALVGLQELLFRWLQEQVVACLPLVALF